MDGTDRKTRLAIVLWLFLAWVAGCAGGGENGSWWPWGQKQTAKDNMGVLAPSEEILALRKLAQKAATSTPAEQEQYAQLLVSGYQREADPVLRAEIVRTLAKIPTATAAHAVQAALKSPDAEVRVVACDALTVRGDAAAVAALAEALAGDVDVDVRLAAAKALGKTHDPAAVAALGSVLEDPNPAIQYRAVQSLRSATGKDFGNNVNRWRQYVRGELPQDRPPSLAERIRKIF